MRKDTKFAIGMLMPTALIVLGIVLFPLLVNIWISFKSIKLSDLRPPQIFVSENLKGELKNPGDEALMQYRLRNSSQDKEIRSVRLTDTLPAGTELAEPDERCGLVSGQLTCDLGDWEAKKQEVLALKLRAGEGFSANDFNPRDIKAVTAGESDFALLDFNFNLDNYRKVFSADDFWSKLKVTFFYTFFGTVGALILGLFAAQLLNVPFRGRSLLRGLLLFPYVSPVIAVAFTWIFFLDPFSGFLNSMLKFYGVTDSPVNFLGTQGVPVDFFGLTFEFPLALVTVTAFEAWRYFPLAFLFILARMQAMPADINEAARVDGASPFQLFFHISLPQLVGIISVLFLLRFIWTFNKFDDIYLMTGGASGTTTLTVDVYRQAFALSDLGAGAAVAVVIFILLVVFATLQIRFSGKDENI